MKFKKKFIISTEHNRKTIDAIKLIEIRNELYEYMSNHLRYKDVHVSVISGYVVIKGEVDKKYYNKLFFKLQEIVHDKNMFVYGYNTSSKDNLVKYIYYVIEGEVDKEVVDNFYNRDIPYEQLPKELEHRIISYADACQNTSIVSKIMKTVFDDFSNREGYTVLFKLKIPSALQSYNPQLNVFE